MPERSIRSFTRCPIGAAASVNRRRGRWVRSADEDVHMWSDLRYAFRSFGKTPALTAILILTLALGIGANTAIFSVIDAVLLRATPIGALDRLAMVWQTDRNTGTTREPASFPDYLDFKSRSRTFAQLAAVMAGEVN